MLEEEIPLHQEKSISHYVAAMQKRRCGRDPISAPECEEDQEPLWAPRRDATFRNEVVVWAVSYLGWREEHRDVVIRQVAADL